ncbi:hypothetical protein Droror1_Dr00008115 [Drosera rotundifolia]
MEPLNDDKPIKETLTHLLHLCDSILAAIPHASESHKPHCAHLGQQVSLLAARLRSLHLRLLHSSSSTATVVYSRPVRLLAPSLSSTLSSSLSLLIKSRRRRNSLLHHAFTFLSASDFKKLTSRLDHSLSHLHWLVEEQADIALSPTITYIWSLICCVQTGELSAQIKAANVLCSLAERDDDGIRDMIVEEGGVGPLLRLMERKESVDAQVAAANALYNVADDSRRVRAIVENSGVGVMVRVMNVAAMKVQIIVARLSARMVEGEAEVREVFGKENMVRALVSLISFDTFEGDDDGRVKQGRQSVCSVVEAASGELETKKTTTVMKRLHSLQSFTKPVSNETDKKQELSMMQRQQTRPRLMSLPSFYSDVGGRVKGIHLRKERENEAPEVKHELKVVCAKALMLLAKDSVANSRTITETKGLLCLAKLIEKEEGELQMNCLLAVMEITATAGGDADLRRAAFKSNSPAAKAVVEQIMKMATTSKDPAFQIPAIRSIASLARMFPAKETRVIHQLVGLIENKEQDVAMEAAIALGKFASPENFLCREHSRTMVESHGILPLIKLVRDNFRRAQPVLVLLCHLALHAGEKEGFNQIRVMTTLDGAFRTTLSQDPELKLLIPKALSHLKMYQHGMHPH